MLYVNLMVVKGSLLIFKKQFRFTLQQYKGIMKKIILLVLFVSSFTIYSQSNKIIKLELQDSILKKTIADFIVSQKEVYPKFEKEGYIQLRQTYFNKYARQDSLKFQYDISDQYYRPTNNLPGFYTYIEGKLVLIFDNSLTSINFLNSKKRQRKINRLVKPYLSKTIHLKIKDDSGKVIINDKHFRDESITIHGGVTLSIYENGKVIIKSGNL